MDIEYTGNIAEIIDDAKGRYVRIICQNNNMMIQLDNIDDISLGDSIVLTGKLSISSVSINGILNESDKQ